MQHIRKELIGRELVVIPVGLEVVNHYQHTYKCTHCSENDVSGMIVKESTPKGPIQKSIISASLITEILYLKYVQKVPAYRQEAHWKNYEFDLTRNIICNCISLYANNI
ncbi:hypothetical protein CL176_02440 [Suicoccus acidiformans]|uniref:Transposase IS66 central domain-containing protein n=1 Tax=Suicoccus acidiformans TaxID=2036206 RepID=A0A347WIR8_9LACT|nr:hypothetical protein CL176_02440 [Suicoccus acidiformans]